MKALIEIGIKWYSDSNKRLLAFIGSLISFGILFKIITYGFPLFIFKRTMTSNQLSLSFIMFLSFIFFCGLGFFLLVFSLDSDNEN